MKAELITGPERDETWGRITAMARGYQAHTTKTDSELPVFRPIRR